MPRSLSFLLLLVLATLLGGCASREPKPDDADRVSTIPWNRPERWEGQGGLGGFMPGTN